MTVDDLDPLSAVLGAPDPVRPTRTPRTGADTERWIAWNQDNYRTYGFGLWVIETHDGRFVGDCGLTMQDIEGEQHLEVGYHVALDLRGRGLASEAAAAVRQAATEAAEPHLVAIIRPENLPSQRVAHHIGLRLERRAVKNGEVLVFGADLLRVLPVAPERLAAWREVHNEIIPTSPLSQDEVAERATRHRLTVGTSATPSWAAPRSVPRRGSRARHRHRSDPRAVPAARARHGVPRRGPGGRPRPGAEPDSETVVLETNADGLEFAVKRGFVEHERYVVDGQTVPFVDLHLEERP